MSASTPKLDHVHATQALGLLIRLVGLDDLWTREAQRPAESRKTDELAKLLDELLRLWRDLQVLVPALGVEFDRSGAELSKRFDDLVEGRVEVTRRDGRREPAFTDELRKRVREQVDQRAGGDVTALARQAVETADGVIDRECVQVKAEFGRIATGARSGGDMSKEAEAFVHTLAIVVAAETGPIGGLLVEGAAALLDWLFG